MRLLVLGGTAFLGRELARAGLGRGHDVTCVARGRSGAPADGTRLVRADRDDPDAGLGGVEHEDWDAVLDVARDPGQVRRAVAALAGRVGHWGFVSTGNVYADHSVPGADESTPLLAPRDVGGDDPDAYGGAKVACEQAVLDGLGPSRTLVARAGLLGGPGDASGRTGWWPWRFARPAAPGRVLAPAALGDPVQVLDVRDLAAWMVRCAESGTAGVVDAVGPTTTLGRLLEASREAAGGAAEVVAADPAWLAEQGVDAWMGPRSLPLWLPFPEYGGFASRTGEAARALGLTHRPLLETLRDTLAWEESRPADQPRRTGLDDEDERALLAGWVEGPGSSSARGSR
ncbi:NAD-dependent epimerase/dehydratase family protein [Phycicoccus sp. MAQZ13P-2]|uniref:NAD-dependent epimerase/dehydratase family protein n=1 Tax=Phycicoccus mangrovi TaxID=2840470 RepID=UPI001C006226|nr:NAD-dependent epimerase/dehydratase family protein [Phycicoccus mangrovi]MBT9254340.1 NAD-dependent epimerase/dehydratase family protein [Phycicoccus mangrovi]MBT9272718.1 NAD-dependent epimerase/dehydratase family protein [Phycicoccus mangrovi]